MNFQTSGSGCGAVMTKVEGSCNGLLCLVQSPVLEEWAYDYNNKAVYIINPLLGEVMMLPQVNQSDDIDFVLYGLGFSKHSDHFKVLRIVGTHGRRIHVEIFTIGVDKKWRSFEDSSIPCLIFEFGVNLNGVVYFIGGVVRDSGLILAFDMEEERGHAEFGDKRSNIALEVCNDNLCLTDNSNEHQVVIWTMKRNGVVESWSKEIMMKSWIPLDLSFDRLIPVTILRNEDLLMSRQCSLFDNSKVVIIYNPKTNECSTHEFSDGEEESSYSFVYVPGFFPLSTVL